MKRTSLNFLVDVVAFAVFGLLAACGILMEYVLPHGAGHFSTLWGLDRHEWGTVHFWIAVVLLATLGLHLILHWHWIVSVVKGHSREGTGMRVGLALVGLFALMALFLSPFLSGVEQTGVTAYKTRLNNTEARDQFEIRGSLSLGEMEELTGVSVPELLGTFGLPADLPKHERLGRLCRTYGLEMEEIRMVVQECRKKR